ncbi:hypothetical protein SEPCBS119000_005761 [Sporothrix epigloea]|uniref:Ras guanyl-nucleotide exchange factor n=1 Tax=Sporothrix epigloea TaxID=1892477 RepID=A0ABP0DZA8_9PEZI
MEAINVAVIGAEGTGKSSFIQQAMRLPEPPTTGITGMRLNIDGRPCIVTLIELDLEHFDIDSSLRIRWPKSISGNKVPHVDGALMLYDVMNKDSVRNLPPTLAALHSSNLPTVLVATKCDHPESSRQINADALAAVFPTIFAKFKTSANTPSNIRDCLQAIVLAAMYQRKDVANVSSHKLTPSSATTSITNDNTARPAATAPTINTPTTAHARRRAASSAAHLDSPPDGIKGHLLSSEQGSGKHSRASSDLSLLRGRPATPRDRESYYRSQHSRSPRVDYTKTAHVGNPGYGAEMTDEHLSQSAQGTLRSSGERNNPLDAGLDSFLYIEESEAESLRYMDDVPILQRNDEDLSDKPAKAAGVYFDELVDRLLTAPITLADKNFADVFLCLYRKFAAPHQLLSAIISALDKTWNDKTLHFLERTATQFRYVEVVVHWISLYPGDFARPASKKMLEGLVWRLAGEPVFALAAQQLRKHLENDVTEDDDTWWAKCDDPPAGDSTAPEFVAQPSGYSGRGPDLSDSMRSLIFEDSRSSDRPSSETGSIGAGPGAVTGNTSTSLSPRRAVPLSQFQSYEDYEREAATMVPMGTLPLNKFRYHIFMDMDTNAIADEITRIDWIMFNSIRIRDLVRHVSLPAQEKERCRSFTSINRMVSHFNHVARWVTNMILIRDKAKHRAPCLQKFMCIALRLRQLRNYNSLAAVVAGLNGMAIHRLAQTKALIDPDVQKRFARLLLLMSSQKSHFTYRLAWENSPLPRIPFMPLHRRDLVSAEAGSRTFVGPNGDQINWRKFEVLGEVLLPIMKSQGTPYSNLTKQPATQEMVLDCRMPMDEEETYQRSVQVEPAGAAVDMKKKFPWLPK